jgi:hypothetical protein
MEYTLKLNNIRISLSYGGNGVDEYTIIKISIKRGINIMMNSSFAFSHKLFTEYYGDITFSENLKDMNTISSGRLKVVYPKNFAERDQCLSSKAMSMFISPKKRDIIKENLGLRELFPGFFKPYYSDLIIVNNVPFHFYFDKKTGEYFECDCFIQGIISDIVFIRKLESNSKKKSIQVKVSFVGSSVNSLNDDNTEKEALADSSVNSLNDKNTQAESLADSLVNSLKDDNAETEALADFSVNDFIESDDENTETEALANCSVNYLKDDNTERKILADSSVNDFIESDDEMDTFLICLLIVLMILMLIS